MWRRRKTGEPGGGVSARETSTGARQFQELWVSLGRREWTSIVLVPADASGSTADLARSLVEVGRALSAVPVSAITVAQLDYGSARALSELQDYAHREALPGELRALVEVGATAIAGGAAAPAGPSASASEAIALAPMAQVVISIPAVVAHPLGIAVARQADAVLLAVELGRTALADARRTIELIGRERIAGCVLVR